MIETFANKYEYNKKRRLQYGAKYEVCPVFFIRKLGVS